MPYFPDDPEYNPEPPDEPEAVDDDEDEGYAKYDPKHPTYNARMSDLWDLRDKTA